MWLDLRKGQDAKAPWEFLENKDTYSMEGASLGLNCVVLSCFATLHWLDLMSLGAVAVNVNCLLRCLLLLVIVLC